MGDFFCDCGLAVMRTSWSHNNPGRRYICCRFHQQQGSCGYWRWIDPPMCTRAIEVIRGLQQRIRQLEMNLPGAVIPPIVDLQENNRAGSNGRAWTVVVISWVFFLLYWAMN